MDSSRWNTIYPAYLNSKRTVAEGRRISKRQACADPRWQEIKDVLESTGNFQVIGEPNKVYPRELDKESPANRGRVKYQVTRETDKLKNKKDILVFLAGMIPQLKSRSQKGAGQAQVVEASAATAAKKKKGKK